MSPNDPTTQRGDRFEDLLNPPQVLAHLLADDGTFPNNARLPLLAYPGALRLSARDLAAAIEALLRTNGWGGSWRNGVYSFHHYHSTAHEVLGVYAGRADVQLGGEDGIVVAVSRGDVVIIPAGVAHKNLGASRDFRVVGAYPRGQHPDMNHGRAEERPRADENIAAVPLPAMDPIYGDLGPLVERWRGGGR
jgi:uncharacterized protein YjlB